MNRESFLSILREENVQFRIDRVNHEDVIIREEYVLMNPTAYIIPDKAYIDAGIFQTTMEPTPLSKVTREELMKLVEAYRNTDK